MSEIDQVRVLIASRALDSQRRINTAAQILRDLIAKDDKHPEMELAFTLVMAELAA
jgi:hypothetical protein